MQVCVGPAEQVKQAYQPLPRSVTTVCLFSSQCGVAALWLEPRLSEYVKTGKQLLASAGWFVRPPAAQYSVMTGHSGNSDLGGSPGPTPVARSMGVERGEDGGDGPPPVKFFGEDVSPDSRIKWPKSGVIFDF